MTKNEFLLSVAIDCAQTDEGVDFDFGEVVGGSDYGDAFAEHYAVIYFDDPDERTEQELEANDASWEKAKSDLKSDMVRFLIALKLNINAISSLGDFRSMGGGDIKESLASIDWTVIKEGGAH
jgi:hypothetical protein